MAEERFPELMRGHLEECLAHLRNRINEQIPKGGKGIVKLKRPIAEFCGVGTETVTTWFNDQPILPQAPILFRLWCYLDLIGYRVIELERMSPGRRNYLELVGYGVLTGPEAGKLLGYSQPSTFYQAMQGIVGASEEKEQRMWELWKERRETLERKKAEAVNSSRSPAVVVLRNPGRVKFQEPRESIGKVVSSAGQVLAVFSIVDGLLRLFDAGMAEEIPPEVAASLKKEVAKIFRLTTHLTNLGAKVTSIK